MANRIKKGMPRVTSFGITVRKRLIDKNMTQRNLAAQLNVKEQYLYQILSGYRSGKKYRDKIVKILEL